MTLSWTLRLPSRQRNAESSRGMGDEDPRLSPNPLQRLWAISFTHRGGNLCHASLDARDRVLLPSPRRAVMRVDLRPWLVQYRQRQPCACKGDCMCVPCGRREWLAPADNRSGPLVGLSKCPLGRLSGRRGRSDRCCAYSSSSAAMPVRSASVALVRAALAGTHDWSCIWRCIPCTHAGADCRHLPARRDQQDGSDRVDRRYSALLLLAADWVRGCGVLPTAGQTGAPSPSHCCAVDVVGSCLGVCPRRRAVTSARNKARPALARHSVSQLDCAHVRAA